MDRADVVEAKSWNQNDGAQKFIKIGKKMIINYISLAIHSPEIFENADLSIPGDFKLKNEPTEPKQQMALKLLQLLFWKMRFEVFLAVAKNIDDIEQVYGEMAFMLLLSSQNYDLTQVMTIQIVEVLT
jgi:hypothetical protein